MKRKPYSKSVEIVATLLRLAAGLFLVCAGLYNQWVFKLLKPHAQNGRIFLAAIRTVQFEFLLIGFALLLLAWLVVNVRFLRSLANRELAVNLSIFGLVLFTILVLLELSFRPLMVRNRSEIFMEDRELGWKLRPGAEDLYIGTIWKINGKGLVGPELEYAKPDNVTRLLYLGDSVTFGHGLPGYRQAYPYVIEDLLKERTGAHIETANAAVHGYNTRQELIYLNREGIKYHPDCVVLGFILNDVTDRLPFRKGLTDTTRNGLTEPALSWDQRIYANSGIMYLVRKLRDALHIESAALRDAKKFNPDLQSVEQFLTSYPDRPDVKQAWAAALGDLSRMAQFCRDNHTPLLVVAFPYVYQFDDPEKLSGPQKVLADFCREQSIPMLDLLPGMAAQMQQTGKSTRDFFFDQGHPSVLGHQFAAEKIADFLFSQGLIHPQAVDPFTAKPSKLAVAK